MIAYPTGLRERRPVLCAGLKSTLQALRPIPMAALLCLYSYFEQKTLKEWGWQIPFVLRKEKKTQNEIERKRKELIL